MSLRLKSSSLEFNLLGSVKLFMISALSGFWMRKMENVVTTFIKRVSVLSYSISIVCLCLARFNSITVNLTNLVMRLDFF